ncbi:MAG: GTPase HflX [Bacilli bacterium]|nr:GTPase HflX [Bacilli bacterium]
MNKTYNNFLEDQALNELDVLRGVIVCINTGDDEIFSYETEELKNLCAATNIEVIDEVYQNLSSPLNSTYIGSGKLNELKMIVESLNADLVIFNDELSPAQLKNIKKYLGDDITVFDRTMLILDLFERRAKTKEASLQVEIARLKYNLPRLIGSRTYLSRVTGGGAGGGGARRGLGETKLELDRRHIEKNILRAKNELEKITKARSITREKRSNNNLKVVAFVGYTNAGKSSTINTLLNLTNKSDKDVFVKDMLFATLSTSTRSIKLENNHEFLLTDTIGFVSKLPHHLVESFKSTLEEIKEASLIVHVVDASSPYMDKQIETTREVLRELNALDIPSIFVFNKVDLIKEPRFITSVYPDALMISSITKQGYEELIKEIETHLFPKEYVVTYKLPYNLGNIYNNLKEKATVLHTTYENDGIMVTCRVSEYYYNLYHDFLIVSSDSILTPSSTNSVTDGNNE